MRGEARGYHDELEADLIPWSRCNRETRLAAFEMLPRLMDEIIIQANRMVESARRTAARVRELIVDEQMADSANLVEIFDGRDAAHDDQAFQRWIAGHSDGYVLNTYRNPSAKYMPLHRASCNGVTELDKYQPGAYTERDYIKVCADTREALADWVRVNGRPDGSFTSEACRCHRRVRG